MMNRRTDCITRQRKTISYAHVLTDVSNTVFIFYVKYAGTGELSVESAFKASITAK